ncbi:hypothetical protein [Actinokineospora cianjurensis]|uniref:Uncharacterized protein n=1 Tax=Actinokineospora cianjurensis TaxID=585224 RepID=A0A421B2L0_9PSEU|nr:hypothetical protein [Actinokineospora cianjurensis]RLK58575.1 hypothetical protein CLV68_3046 [Actinokineospora cianjurensis]
MTRPTRGVRVIGGDLHTAVQTWTRADSHSIILIGLCHVGETDYYAAVEGILDTHLDAEVLCEGVIREQPPPALTVREQTRLAHLDGWGLRRLLEWAAAATGLQLQSRGLTRREYWRNADVTAVDLLRVSGHLRRIDLPDPDDMSWPDGLQARRAARMLRRLLIHSSRWSHLTASRSTRLGIVDLRNINAIVAALRIVHDSPVLLPWGAGHLSG